MKLFNSELKVMELLWKHKSLSAKEIAEILCKEVGWSKTTTYTVIKKCIDKGAAQRTDPGFVCSALISNDEVREFETNELIDKMFDGSADLLVASLIKGKRLSKNEIDRLVEIINKGNAE